MASDKAPQNRPHDDALAALHGLGQEAASSEEPAQDPHAEEEPAYEVAKAVQETEPSPSASGFVGMLSKSGTPQDELVPSRPGSPPPPSPRPTPQPSSEADAAPSLPRAAGTDEIRMAREITMPASAAPLAAARTGARGGPRGRKVPGWYHVAVPIMFTLSSLLLIIGFWALGAVIYVLTASPKTPDDVGYPLISWDTNIGDYGGISSGSKLMAFIMLIALPVAICLVVMAIIMQRQVSKAAQAATKKF